MRAELPQRIRACPLLASGEHIVCAVSGGADSMALLWLLWSQRQALNITVTAAHFNHRLRGCEAQRDEEFVRTFCQAHGIPLQLGAGDAADCAAAWGQSVEQAARTLRYRFLHTLSCDRIATAHTADDNAETVLMNLLRGTGLRGLCGIPEQRGKLIRPLLHTTRAEIEDYLQQAGIAHVEDSTNAADDALRNRIRHRILPLCKQENPNLLAAIDRMTGLLRQDEAALQQQVQGCLSQCKRDGGYNVPQLRALPQALRQRVLRQLLQPIDRVTCRHVQALDALLFSPCPSAQAALPEGITAVREYDCLRLSTAQTTAFLPVRLKPNGVTALPELGLTVCCAPAETPAAEGAFTVVPHGEIWARPRRTGDVMTLSGGTKALKKIMIDRKIPRHLRDRLPVFADSDGVLAVHSIGVNLSRTGTERAITIQVLSTEDNHEQ